MKEFLWLISLYGFVIGFVSASLSHLLPRSSDPNQNDTNIGIALFFFGVGSIIGGSLTGKIIDKIGMKKSAWIAPLLFIITLLIEIYFLLIPNSVMGTCIVAYFLGSSLSFSNAFIMLQITLSFEARLESFAIYLQIRLIFYIIYQWMVNLISSHFNMEKSMIG